MAHVPLTPRISGLRARPSRADASVQGKPFRYNRPFFGREFPDFWTTATSESNKRDDMAVQELLGFIEPSNLNATTIVLATVAISGVAYLISTFFTWWRLRHIPGPFLNSITPLLLTYHCIKADVTKYTYTLHEKYGPLVRIQPNMVMFSDPDTFRYICSQKAGYTKGLWFEFTRWDLKRWSLTSLRDNETRKIRKAQVSPAVSVVNSVFCVLLY